MEKEKVGLKKFEEWNGGSLVEVIFGDFDGVPGSRAGVEILEVLPRLLDEAGVGAETPLRVVLNPPTGEFGERLVAASIVAAGLVARRPRWIGIANWSGGKGGWRTFPPEEAGGSAESPSYPWSSHAVRWP